MGRCFFELRIRMQIKVRRVAAPQTRRHVRRQIKAVAHAPLATLRGTHLALSTPSARQWRLDDNAITLTNLPPPAGVSTDLLDPTDRFVPGNDRHFAEASDLEFAKILIVIGAAQ